VIFIRTLANVMEKFECSEEMAQAYLDLREEGYPRHQAALMAGLIDPPDPDAEKQEAK
jgi:hypothetical protein